MLEALAANFAASAGKGLGQAIGGGGGGPFSGGDAAGGAYGTTLDGSGWIVNMGGTQTATASPTRTTVDPVSGFITPTASMAGVSQPMMLAMLGLAAVWFYRHRRKG